MHVSTSKCMQNKERCEDCGPPSVYSTERRDRRPGMGRFVMDIIQRIAQLESEQIGERVYMGMSQKAKEGPGILGFHPPLGYDLAEGRLVPNEREAPLVREMFTRCGEGRTLEEIAVGLNQDGYRTKRDTEWTPVKVYRILHNPVYAGFLRWDGIVRRAEHEPVVTVETFNAAQKGLRSRALLSNARSPPVHLNADAGAALVLTEA